MVPLFILQNVDIKDFVTNSDFLISIILESNVVGLNISNYAYGQINGLNHQLAYIKFEIL